MTTLALTACSASALAGTPAAAAVPELVDAPGEPALIAPGASGTVTIGLENRSAEDAVDEGHMYMEVWAPDGSRFTDLTLTPLDGAPGGWTCDGDQGTEGQPYESTVLKRASDEKGIVAAAGKTARWRMSMKMFGDTPSDVTLPSTGEGQRRTAHVLPQRKRRVVVHVPEDQDRGRCVSTRSGTFFSRCFIPESTGSINSQQASDRSLG